ncbi:hypothetical protein [Aggregatibacter segnis]|jgi:hypothetical protein|uniref:Uncharacterized protein n=2 Tax=Aggregatibacter TaxID=416916 RepID=A0A8B2U266_9PAST|nr:hypothetical protein [Aggregatibacter segnis]RDE70780.1 hypothetical protein DPV83_07225 [Aggregatibacter segnis]RDF00836.1 hypothetical protein DPV99_08065 [Aggregatibacter aphrophilus]
MARLNLEALITKFFTEYLKNNKEIEIYNEFSLQHELGVFLRGELKGNFQEEKYKVQFERNVSFFKLDKSKLEEGFVKREIDICIYNEEEKYAIELKFPTNGQVPEQMYAFIKDIKFMEQVKESGFTGAFSVCLVNNSEFYSLKSKNDDIYSYFRIEDAELPSSKEIEKPTGKRDQRIKLKKSYRIKWNELSKDVNPQIRLKRDDKNDPIKFYIIQIEKI